MGVLPPFRMLRCANTGRGPLIPDVFSVNLLRDCAVLMSPACSSEYPSVGCSQRRTSFPKVAAEGACADALAIPIKATEDTDINLIANLKARTGNACYTYVLVDINHALTSQRHRPVRG